MKRTSVEDAFAMLHPSFQEAAEAVSARLTDLGVPHALVGGIAVSAHGYFRATKDIDFLVTDDAFNFHGPLVSMKEGLPFRVGDIAVDYVSLSAALESLGDLLVVPEEGQLPIISIEALVLMKLVANRPRDRQDIRALWGQGAFMEQDVAEFLAEASPAHVDLFWKVIDAS